MKKITYPFEIEVVRGRDAEGPGLSEDALGQLLVELEESAVNAIRKVMSEGCIPGRIAVKGMYYIDGVEPPRG